MGPPSKPEDVTSAFWSHMVEVETDSHQLPSNLHALHPQLQPHTHTSTPPLIPTHTPTQWQEWFLSSPALAKAGLLAPPPSLLLPLCSSKTIEKFQLSRNGQRWDPIFLILINEVRQTAEQNDQQRISGSWNVPRLWSCNLKHLSPFLPWVFCLFVKWENSPWWVRWSPARRYSYGPACHPSYSCLRDWMRRMTSSRPAQDMQWGQEQLGQLCENVCQNKKKKVGSGLPV